MTLDSRTRTVLEAYNEQRAQMAHNMAQLDKWLDGMPEQALDGATTWPMVGDICHANELLNEIGEFLNIDTSEVS